LGGSPAFKEIFQFGHAGLKFIDIISFYPTYQHPVLPYTVDSVFQALYEFRQCFCLFYVRQQFITITGAIAKALKVRIDILSNFDQHGTDA
jgi:hypothetical protein